MGVLLALQLILVYPGAPGSPQEAREFLDTLGGFVDGKAGFSPGTTHVDYHNDVAEGVAAIRAGGPAIAVVSLPALCAAGKLPYAYVASPLLDGRAAETVSLVVFRDTTRDDAAAPAARALAGLRLTGTLLSFPAYVNGLVLDSGLTLADFEAVPRPNALLALKALREGDADVALFTQPQLEALLGVVAEGALSTVATSRPLPGAPLIVLGDVPAAEREGVARAFATMCADPEGAELCDTMGVTGFVTSGGDALAAALQHCWQASSGADR